MDTRSHNSRRVVITGIGVFSPIGIGVDRVWESLRAGRSGIHRSAIQAYTAAPDNVLAEVRDFDETSAKKEFLKDLRKSIKLMCREIQLGVASAAQALAESGLKLDEIDHERLGVDFGANLMTSPPDQLQEGCWRCVDQDDPARTFRFERWGTAGLSGMEPLWLLKYLPNMPACHIGIYADARGPSNSITLDEASGNLAIGEACRIIARGSADIMVAGTTGTRVQPIKAIHAALWESLATAPPEPERRCRPFDRDRTGQVIGEGACSFILEEESRARSRGAKIYGTVLGSGASCVVGRDGQPQCRQALVNAMRSALRAAGLTPRDIGHINAHGLGTKWDDLQEAAAIREVFADHPDVPVTALKSYLGNAGSGCGTMELAGSLIALQHGVIPHTLNYDTPDPECGLNVVHTEPQPAHNRVVLKVNVTRMGQASALVVAG